MAKLLHNEKEYSRELHPIERFTSSKKRVPVPNHPGVSVIIRQLKKAFLPQAKNRLQRVIQAYRFDKSKFTSKMALDWFNKNVERKYSNLDRRYLSTRDVPGLGKFLVMDKINGSVDDIEKAVEEITGSQIKDWNQIQSPEANYIFTSSNPDDYVEKMPIPGISNQISPPDRPDTRPNLTRVLPVKKTIDFQGLNIDIEFDIGDERFGKTMGVMYGKVRDHVGNDGESLDVYVGPDEDSFEIFKVTQFKNGIYDEDKYMIYFKDIDHAMNAYIFHTFEGMFGGITKVNIDDILRKDIALFPEGTTLADNTKKLLEDLVISFQFQSDINSEELETLIDDLNRPLKARILVTQADVENLNQRSYSLDSLVKCVNDLQEPIRLGLVIGYETHPDPVYDANGEVVGYNYLQNKPLFKVISMWIENGKVYADVIFFDNLQGIYYSNKIRNREVVSVSLRALGECEVVITTDPNGEVRRERKCQVTRIDGFDIVNDPAMINARVIAFAELRDNNSRKLLDEVSDPIIDDIKVTEQSKVEPITDSISLDHKEEHCNGNCDGHCCKAKNSLNSANRKLIIGDKTTMATPDDTPSSSAPSPSDGGGNADKILSFQQVMALVKLMMGQEGSTMAEEPMTPVDQPATSDPAMTPPMDNIQTDTKGEETNVDAINKPATDTNIPANDNKSLNDNAAVLSALNQMVKLLEKNVAPQQPVVAKPAKTGVTDSAAQLAALKTLLKAVEGLEGKNQQLSDSELNSLKALLEQNAKVKEIQSKEEAAKAISDAVEEFVKVGKVEIKDGEEPMSFDLAELPTELVDSIKASAIKSATNKEEAAKTFKVAIKTAFDANAHRGTNHAITLMAAATGLGRTVQSMTDHSSKAWEEDFNRINQAVEDYRKSACPERIDHVNKYAPVNKWFTDTVKTDWVKQNNLFLNRWKQDQNRAIKDNLLTDAAVLVTNEDISNAPIISLAMIHQMYQILTAMQFCKGLGPGAAVQPGEGGSPGGGLFGAEFKIPYTSFQPPVNAHKKLRIGTTQPIPMATQTVGFESFWAEDRAVAFSSSWQLIEQLKYGALKLDLIAMMIDEVSAYMARVIDTDILGEHQKTCDEFQCVPVDNELAVYTDTVYDVDGSVSIMFDGKEHVYGETVVFAVKLLADGAGGRPIVEPRETFSLSAAGRVVPVTLNDIVVSFAATTQVRGEYRDNEIVPAFPGQVPTYAIDFERGYALFNEASNAEGDGVGDDMPTIDYAYVTNYVDFDLEVTGTAQEYYDGLLQLLTQQKGKLGSSPRFAKVDTVLFPMDIGYGTIGISSLFHQRKSPDGISRSGTWANGDFIGNCNGLDMVTTNGELFGGNRRAILFTNKMVGYAVQSPVRIDGPNNNYVAPSGGGIVQMSAGEQYAMWMRDVIGTPLHRDDDGIVDQHPGITVRFQHDLEYI